MPHSPSVMIPVSPAFYVAMSFYLSSAIFFLCRASTIPDWVLKSARPLLMLAFVAHGVDIGWHGVEGLHPASSVMEALGFLSWILVGLYFVFARKDGLRVLGTFIAPIALIILATARLSPSSEVITRLSKLGRLHIAIASVGVAIFALATVVSLLYLLQERNLKKKNFDGLLFKNSAALETLDTISSRLVAVGFPIFTVAIMLGGIWVAQLKQGYTRPEYPIALVTWFSYGILVVGRSTRGLAGRRAAILTILGFLAAALVLTIYLLRRWVG